MCVRSSGRVTDSSITLFLISFKKRSNNSSIFVLKRREDTVWCLSFFDHNKYDLLDQLSTLESL